MESLSATKAPTVAIRVKMITATSAKMAPSSSISVLGLVLCLSINCGKKAKKKRMTLGFSRFMVTPIRYRRDGELSSIDVLLAVEVVAAVDASTDDAAAIEEFAEHAAAGEELVLLTLSVTIPLVERSVVACEGVMWPSSDAAAWNSVVS